MKLIGLKCSNCGANLEIKKNTKIIKCLYCNATTIIDENIIKIEHKIINDDIDKKLTNAATYLYKLKRYEDAKCIYLELSKIIPENPIVWKGIILAETENFNKLSMWENDYAIDFDLIKGAFDSYEALETDELLLKEFQKDYNNYMKTSNNEAKKIKNKSILIMIFSYFVLFVLIMLLIVLLT